MEPALGAAPGLGRWFMGSAVLLNAGVFQMWRRRSATTAHRALPVSDWPALGMLWAIARYMQTLQCAAAVDEPALGAAAGRGRWLAGNAFFAEF